MKSTTAIAALAIAATSLVPLDARADRVRLDSRWRDIDIVVDGSDAEWRGPLVPLDPKVPVTLAAANDGQFLYLVLRASDPVARARILRQGLIVWLDPGGGDRKHLGIKYPVGMGTLDMSGRGWRAPGGFGGGGRRAPGDAPPPDAGQGEAASFEPANRLEVLGPKKDDARNFVTDRVPGISVKIGEVEGSLVYELKVPIARTPEFEYAIDAKPGALIGLGLETLKMEPAPREGRGGGGMGAGGMGGRGGGGRGGGGRGGGGRGMGGGVRAGDRLKPIKTWGLLQLAAK